MPISQNTLDQIAMEVAVPSHRGRPGKDLGLGFSRELDLVEVNQMLGEPRESVPLIKTLRSSHHQVARLVAEGRDQVEIAELAGYSAQYIHLLCKDPSFTELVTYYQGQVREIHIDTHKKLASVGQDALEVLHEKLTMEPEKFTIPHLMSLAEMSLDRSVAPPKRAGLGDGASQQGGPVNISVQFVQPGPTPIDNLGPLIEGSNDVV